MKKKKVALPRQKQFDRLRPRVMEIAQRYLGWASRTDRCNRADAEQAVAELYKSLGRAIPTLVWFESPLSACAAAILWDFAEAFRAYEKLPPLDSPIFWYRLRCLKSLDINRQVQTWSLFDTSEFDFRVREIQGLIWRSFDDLPAVVRGSAMHTSAIVQTQLRLLVRDDNWWTLVSAKLAAQLNSSDQAALMHLMSKCSPSLDDKFYFILGEVVATEFRLGGRSSFNEAEYNNAFLSEVIRLLGYEPQRLGREIPAIAEHCWWWRPGQGICILVDRPTEIYRDANGRAHREDGYAIRYGDELAVFSIRDIGVTEDIAFGRFTAADIDQERNVEVRRAMMERYGFARYLDESGAEVVHQDEFGILYRMRPPSGEAMVIVKVINSTPEPDGTYKEYFLPVPPDMRTARQAVAWTFGMEENDYAPRRET